MKTFRFTILFPVFSWILRRIEMILYIIYFKVFKIQLCFSISSLNFFWYSFYFSNFWKFFQSDNRKISNELILANFRSHDFFLSYSRNIQDQRNEAETWLESISDSVHVFLPSDSVLCSTMQWHCCGYHFASSLTCKMQHHEFIFDYMHGIKLLSGRTLPKADKIPSLWEVTCLGL